MSKNSKKWIELVGDIGWRTGSGPGSQFHDFDVAISRHRGQFQCIVNETWGSDQGVDEVHGRNATEGRGDSPAEAADACKQDVMAWNDDPAKRAKCATALRRAVYAADDAIAEDE